MKTQKFTAESCAKGAEMAKLPGATWMRCGIVAVCLLGSLLGLNRQSWGIGQPEATFVVNTTSDVDDGVCDATHCSLREAINAANAGSDSDTISFNITGTGVHTITPLSALPAITRPVVIDGLTQGGEGYSCDSWPPTLLIELNGASAGDGVTGLVIGATNSTVRGLIINRFTGNGLYLSDRGGLSHVECNFIGTNASSAPGLGNSQNGVQIQGSWNNTVGGTTSGTRNVISGNGLFGVSIEWGGATGNVVQGNYIGTNVQGTWTLGNSWSGVNISDLASNNMIGGAATEARNIISGNGVAGVRIWHNGVPGNRVQGNYIGTGVSGTESLGNAQAGVLFGSDADDNFVGGADSGEANLIAHNGGAGVGVSSGINNLVSCNSIVDNGGLGIDLANDGVTANDVGDSDTGPNNLQNFPVLTSVTIGGSSTTIAGTLDSTAETFTLEFFYSTAADSTGYGEGASFLGSTMVTTDGSGNATFSASFARIPGLSYVSATATDLTNSTSEFSPVYQAPTAVFLLDFQAYPVSSGIMLEWTTATEIGNLGFNLYRAESPDGPQTRLNDVLIPAKMPGSSIGATYVWQDEQVSPGEVYYYWLEDVNVYGVSTLHGPVSAGALRYRYYVPLMWR
jgi:CSLREA domain-containing protein